MWDPSLIGAEGGESGMNTSLLAGRYQIFLGIHVEFLKCGVGN